MSFAICNRDCYYVLVMFNNVAVGCSVVQCVSEVARGLMLGLWAVLLKGEAPPAAEEGPCASSTVLLLSSNTRGLLFPEYGLVVFT